MASTNQACAACKYQRRKCAPDCPLAPYFPPDQPKRFLNVHKLFGVSNVLRILKLVEPAKREDAIKSIVYEADQRERDPVRGCLGVVELLQAQMVTLKQELARTRDQLYMVELQQQQRQQQQQQTAFLIAQQNAAAFAAAAAGQGVQPVVHPGLVMSGTSGPMLPYPAQHSVIGMNNPCNPGWPQYAGAAPFLQHQDRGMGHGDSQQMSSISTFVPDARPDASVTSFADNFMDTRPINDPFIEPRPTILSAPYPDSSAGVLSCDMQPALYSNTRHRHQAVPSDQAIPGDQDNIKNAGVYLRLTNN